MKVANFTGLLFACLFTLSASVGTAGDDIELNIESGKALIQTGKFQMSAELLNKLLTQRKDEMKDHPRHAEAWYLFSVSLRKLGRIDLADKALERAKKLRELAQEAKSPADNENKTLDTDFSATVEEQVTASETGKAALADATPVKQPEPPVAPPEPAVENEKNVYDLASLKDQKARNSYRKAMMHLDAGHIQAAADELLAAVDAEPGNIDLLLKTADILEMVGSSYYQKAIRVYAALEKAGKTDLSVKQQTAWARACIYAGKPDLAKAETILSPLLKKEPENVDLLILSAQLATENKKFQPAVQAYEKVIKLDADNMMAYLGLGDVYQRMNQFAKAIDILQKARAQWPDSFMPLVSLGKAYLKNNNNGFALVMFNLAYEMNPDNFDVNLGMLEILARGGDYRANLHLTKCESVIKGDPRVEFWKAVFLELDEYPAKAMQIYSLLALYEDDISYQARLRLGQLYSGKGHESFPGDLLVKDRPRFSRVYRAMSNQEFAYSYFQDYLAKMPDSSAAPAIKRWLYENEEGIRRAREFEALIQSQLQTN
jgi:tetratricopeptide (TPR) repeat protein